MVRTSRVRPKAKCSTTLSWYGAWLESQRVTLSGSSNRAMAPGDSGGSGLGSPS